MFLAAFTPAASDDAIEALAPRYAAEIRRLAAEGLHCEVHARGETQILWIPARQRACVPNRQTPSGRWWIDAASPASAFAALGL